MRAVDYLYQIGYLREEIQDNKMCVEEIRTRACNIVAPMDSERVQGGGNSDRVGVASVRIVDLESEQRQLAIKLCKVKGLCSSCISDITNENYRKILIGKYFDDKSIHQISKELGILDRSTKRAHKKALEQFTAIYDTRYAKNLTDTNKML